MVEPVIVPRAEHAISRREIDPDALKVLYRLKEHGFRAYLVGGSVRDLLLARRPKDFDIGTDAHPYQIKKLFRNCWIIGRRFRLAHVKFGPKTIEVATFRRDVPDVEEPEAPAPNGAAAPAEAAALIPGLRAHHPENTFGTPEQDAFRRDFTMNALFYDIATFSVIDYVGGLADLRMRIVRSIGDPDVRFLEDPVRMLRAIVLATRLDFDLDPPVRDAITRNQALIATASPSRLIEEYYKVLRSGAAERTIHALGRSGLLRHLTPELDEPPETLWRSLRALDAYRSRFGEAPPSLTNAILVGSMLAPLGLITRQPHGAGNGGKTPRPVFGILTVARRDVEHLQQILALQRRLLDLRAPVRGQRGLTRRHVFGEALAWLEIHGAHPDAVEHWRFVASDAAEMPPAPGDRQPGEPGPRPRRRRRRRRGPRPMPPEQG